MSLERKVLLISDAATLLLSVAGGDKIRVRASNIEDAIVRPGEYLDCRIDCGRIRVSIRQYPRDEGDLVAAPAPSNLPPRMVSPEFPIKMPEVA